MSLFRSLKAGFGAEYIIDTDLKHERIINWWCNNNNTSLFLSVYRIAYDHWILELKYIWIEMNDINEDEMKFCEYL